MQKNSESPKGPKAPPSPSDGTPYTSPKPAEKTESIPYHDILAEAFRLTTGVRRNEYGNPLQDFTRTAIMMTGAFYDKLKPGAYFCPADVARVGMLLKRSRSTYTKKRDNWVDAAGYARCGRLCDEADNEGDE